MTSKHIVGGASTAPSDAPAICSPEEAERYCEETYLRYRTEAAKNAPGNPYSLTLPQAQTAHRKSMMLLGRAIAGPDVLYRVGRLDRNQFARLYRQVTGIRNVSEHQFGMLTSITRRAEVKDYLETHIEHLARRRGDTSPQPGHLVRDQFRAQAVFLTHLGQVVEAIGLFHRQGLIDGSAFDAYHTRAMRTLVPTVD